MIYALHRIALTALSHLKALLTMPRNGEQAANTQQGAQMRRIAISVGHVGSDEESAKHPEIGVTEVQSCLRIFGILQAMLDEYRDLEVVYAPTNLNLQHRIEMLNDEHAALAIDIAVELHLNAFTDRNVDGCECLYFPTDATGQAWAEKFQAELVGALMARDRGTKAFDNEKRNGFVRLLDCPSVIVEPLFISNDDRAQQIVNGDAVHRIAFAIFRALIT